jgi:hypothetical protein
MEKLKNTNYHKVYKMLCDNNLLVREKNFLQILQIFSHNTNTCKKIHNVFRGTTILLQYHKWHNRIFNKYLNDL